MVLLTRQEISTLSRQVNLIDPKAFSASAKLLAYGEGFEEIK